jgi:hypothetical protein
LDFIHTKKRMASAHRKWIIEQWRAIISGYYHIIN